MTWNSSGNSSRLVARSLRPNRVRRSASVPSPDRMDRNLSSVNDRPCSPARACRKNTGRPSPSHTASPTPPTAGQAPIDPDAIKFERMTAQFTRSSGRLELQEALIFNRDVGLTTQGFIDYANDKVDLNGTFVPAYQVNSLITNVPIVGTLLGGGQHEGIFGVNYRITGPASAPTLTVNPLSGVTPGILRKIFGVVDGTTPAPTSPPPPNAYAPIQGK